MKNKKPPIGIMPKRIWMEKRFYDVCLAISSYYTAGLKIPIRWVKEYNVFIETFQKKNNNE